MDLVVAEKCPQCDWVNDRLVYEPEWRPGAGSWAGKVVVGVLLVAVTAGLTYFLTREEATVPAPAQTQGQVAAAQKKEPAQARTKVRKNPKATAQRKKYRNHPCARLHRECRRYARRLRKARFSRNPNMSKTRFYRMAVSQCGKATGLMAEFQRIMGYSREINRHTLKSSKQMCKMYRRLIKQLPRRF